MNCELSTLVEFPCLIYLTADGMIPFRMFNPAQSPDTVCRAYFKARPRKSGKSKKGSGNGESVGGASIIDLSRGALFLEVLTNRSRKENGREQQWRDRKPTTLAAPTRRVFHINIRTIWGLRNKQLLWLERSAGECICLFTFRDWQSEERS